VVTLNGVTEVRTPGEQVSFNDVGTLARIKEFHPVQPSLFMIQCHGEQRFRVKSSQTQKKWIDHCRGRVSERRCTYRSS